ncbi:MAG: Ig-like domain-containing protein [Firmicutes bacterium]|nr:Ig-like domain-containing protein [Bacillota bacterium]
MKQSKITRSLLSSLLGLLLAFSLSGGVMAAGGDGSGGGGNGTGSGSGSSTETTTTDTNTTDATTTPGSGDGSGGGSTEPLTLVTATPVDNATDIPVDSAITLEFSKNIAYATVRDGNIKAVTLWAGADPIPANVTMADDQLQPDLRDFITLTPTEPLKEGTVYTVKVDTTLVSKSGAVLTTPAKISFTTVAPAGTSSNMILWVALGALVVVIVLVAVLITKRKKA